MGHSPRARLLLTVLSVLWIFFVLATFFVVQKPFSTANLVAVGSAFLDLLTAFWITFVALGIGTWLLQKFFPSQCSRGEMLIFGTGLGLGVWGLLSFGLGLAGLFNPFVAYGVTILFTIFLALHLFRLLRQWRKGWPERPPHGLITIYLLLITLFALLVALLPPTDWDGLFYHLTGPKLYLEAGGIVGGIDIPHLSFPSLMEMLFAWAMLLRGDIAAKLLHTVFAFLLTGLVYVTAKRFFSQMAAWLAVLVFASIPMIGTLAGWAYNDLALAFYQFAAIYSLISWFQVITQKINQPAVHHSSFTIRHSSLSWLILAGVFTGLAMGLKYTSFVTPLVLSVLIIWYSYRPRWVTVLTNLAAFSLAAMLVAAPWYLKNWIFTGNPVYPFLYNIFGGAYWSEFRANWYGAGGTGIGWQPGTLLTLPWLLTLGIHDVNYWDGRTGPLILLFLPLMVASAFMRRSQKPAALNTLLIYALTQYGFWTLAVIWSRSLWQSRLLLPSLVALAPVTGWLWTQLADIKLPHFSLGRFVNIAVGLTLLLIVVDTGLLTLKVNPLPYLVGEETHNDYLLQQLGAHYATMEEINQQLPAKAVVVFLWEPRSYYCQRDCRPDSILDTFPHLVHQHGSAEAIAQAWRQAGVTHVLIHRMGLSFVLSESPESIDTDILRELETDYLEPVFDVAGAYQGYVLK